MLTYSSASGGYDLESPYGQSQKPILMQLSFVPSVAYLYVVRPPKVKSVEEMFRVQQNTSKSKQEQRR